MQPKNSIFEDRALHDTLLIGGIEPILHKQIRKNLEFSSDLHILILKGKNIGHHFSVFVWPFLLYEGYFRMSSEWVATICAGYADISCARIMVMRMMVKVGS